MFVTEGFAGVRVGWIKNEHHLVTTTLDGRLVVMTRLALVHGMMPQKAGSTQSLVDFQAKTFFK